MHGQESGSFNDWLNVGCSLQSGFMPQPTEHTTITKCRKAFHPSVANKTCWGLLALPHQQQRAGSCKKEPLPCLNSSLMYQASVESSEWDGRGLSGVGSTSEGPWSQKARREMGVGSTACRLQRGGGSTDSRRGVSIRRHPSTTAAVPLADTFGSHAKPTCTAPS